MTRIALRPEERRGEFRLVLLCAILECGGLPPLWPRRADPSLPSRLFSQATAIGEDESGGKPPHSKIAFRCVETVWSAYISDSGQDGHATAGCGARANYAAAPREVRRPLLQVRL